jgi:transglutaminase-like putative cysteine protease
MLYDITLKIVYEYAHAADSSRHMIRLMPAELEREQRLIAGTLDVQPRPSEWINGVDFFGNRFAELAFFSAHEKITFLMQARVERMERESLLDMSPQLGALGQEIYSLPSVEPTAPHHFLGPSPRVPDEPAITGYAHQALSGLKSVFEAVRSIGNMIRRDMRYDPEATAVDTPVIEAFRKRRGVCQDYSHIMIAALRGIGIPAGYVSGFIRTNPPPGKKRLEGADAMHAWVKAWCGNDMGWVEYDPTNGMAAGIDHVVIARGRDYSDIAPVRGIMRSYGEHKSEQSVDVVPVTKQPVR